MKPDKEKITAPVKAAAVLLLIFFRKRYINESDRKTWRITDKVKPRLLPRKTMRRRKG